MPPAERFSPGVVGSTDWAGGNAPAGGTHTGQSTITTVSGATYVVAHSRAEVLTRLDGHAVAPPNPKFTSYVSFDQPGSSVPVVLLSSAIANVR